MQRQKMGFREYVEALEEERQKIQVFSRELPLSLELVSQAIDAYRQQLSGTTEYNVHGQSDCSEQTSMEEGPVLEEFIPIKKRDSPDCDDEEDEDEQHSHMHKILKDNNNKNSDKRKSDWLRSVQLWNPDPPTKEDLPRKATVVEVKRNGGAFQPFHREDNNNVEKTNNNNNINDNNTSAAKSASPAAVPAMSSTGGGGGGSKRSEEKEGQGQRKQRRCWSPELHKRFLQALQQLGGPDCATPKQIRELMKVDGLTNDEVKSHLQKFRLHTRRPSPMIHNNATSQTAPFVLVGNIFMQPPEYAAAVATSTASGEVTTVTTPTGIYAPVAAHPLMPVAVPVPPVEKKAQVKQLEQSHSDEERVNHGSEGAVHSNSSPDSSSSTHTTSHSHGY